MIKKYALAVKVGVVAIITGLITYYRNRSKRYKGELDGIEKDSKLSQLEAQARAEAADNEAIEHGNRRSTDAINRARNGDRSHFE